MFRSRILGPHLEELAREWTLRCASPDTLGGPVSIVGAAVLNDPAGRARHEIDVVALPRGETLHRRGARIQAIGEAKATTRPRGGADVVRLDAIRSLLAGRGHDVADTRLLLFSRTSFDPQLREAVHVRRDVELIDLRRLYAGS